MIYPSVALMREVLEERGGRALTATPSFLSQIVHDPDLAQAFNPCAPADGGADTGMEGEEAMLSVLLALVYPPRAFGPRPLHAHTDLAMAKCETIFTAILPRRSVLTGCSIGGLQPRPSDPRFPCRLSYHPTCLSDLRRIREPGHAGQGHATR